MWGFILLISLILAAGIVWIQYHRVAENRELTNFQLRLLMLLRFLTVFFIALLFAAPLIKTVKRITQPPKVILAVDNSVSMTGLTGGEEERSRLATLAGQIGNELEQRFEVIYYTFGEQDRRDGELTFSEKRTDYSQVLESVYNNHFNENIGALVLIGDGRFNQGENPRNRISRLVWPVYTLGTGDTTVIKDVRISAVRTNKTAFTGNRFPVEADIRMTGMEGQSVLFSIYHNGNPLYTQTLRAEGTDFFVPVSFTMDATSQGLQVFTAAVSEVPGEQNKGNNRMQFVINILDNRQKVAILSQGAHPDAGAIKNALEQQINYEVSLFYGEPYPIPLDDYNLLIFNQIPSNSQTGRTLFEQIRGTRVPMLFIVGTQTFLPQFNLLGTGAEIVPRAGDFEEAQPSVNPNFTSFTLSDELKENLTRYPPLKVPFAQYNLDPGLTAVVYQKIKNFVTTRPLVAVGTYNGRKAGFIMGEGIWRWRMYNYILSEGHDEFYELIDKLVQFLALRTNDDNFMINYNPVFPETDHVTFTAEVYNKAYEMITSPEVGITVTDSTGHNFEYTFDQSGSFYKLDAGIFPPGKYHFAAQTAIGTETFTESGNFAVIPVNLEQIDLRADHRILYQLSAETGGRFFLREDVSELVRAVAEDNSIKPVNYFQTLLNDILNLKWIFFVLLMLLSLEWFFRKFWGIY